MPVRLWASVLHNAAASDLEHFPIHLDAMTFEDLARVLSDSFEATRSKRQNRGTCAREADPQKSRVCRRRDVVRNFGKTWDLIRMCV